jgi:hypothetical protein
MNLTNRRSFLRNARLQPTVIDPWLIIAGRAFVERASEDFLGLGKV